MTQALPQTPAHLREPAAGAESGERQHQLMGEDQLAGEDHIAWLVAEASDRKDDKYQYLLVLRFALVNMVAFSLLGAAYLHGLVDQVLAADPTKLSLGIFLIFLMGLSICGLRVVQTSRDLNRVRNFNPLIPSRAARYLARLRGRSAGSRTLHADGLRLKLANRIAIVRNTANSLILLGLIGTVLGFIIALSGVDPAHVSEVESVAPMVATLIEGMSVALYTTLVGAVLNLWLMINHYILTSGTVKLLTALVEFGEARARA